MCPPGVIEPTMIEICGVISVESATIVFEIDPVMIVTIPGRIIVVSIARELCFDHSRSGIVPPCINRSGSNISRSGRIYSGCRDSGSYINSGSRNPETNMRAYEYLRIAFSSDEAGGYNGGKDK
jgi:hypothetical protein